MINPVVDKNIEILKKIRLLNIEKDNLLYLDYSAWKVYCKFSIDQYYEDKNKIIGEIEEIEKKIKEIKESIISVEASMNKNMSTSVKDIDKSSELNDLRLKVLQKDLSDISLELEVKNDKLKDVEGEILNLENILTTNEKLSKDAENENNNKIIEICRSINYMKDLLNKEVVASYDLIERNFKAKKLRYVVANIVDGFCENCCIDVPLYQKDLILDKSEFVMCNTCGCFLVNFTDKVE